MEKMEAKKRIVLVPVSAQGHVTPMMLLGKALSLKGFSITIAQGEFNRVSSSSQHFSGFQFVTIPESDFERLGPIAFALEKKKTSEASFKDCIAQLLLQQGNDIACIIYDEFMYFCGAAAKEFKLPSIIFSTQSATNQVLRSVLSKLNAEKFLIDIEDLEVQDKVVENLHPLRYKHLRSSGLGPVEPLLEPCRELVNKRTASAIILNTTSCLESPSLSWLQQELEIPVYPLGLLHITVSANSSFLEEDRSCIEWLNKQKSRSVSLGSMSHIEEKEILEMSWGLCNSNQPFLWVIRPGSVPGSESLLEKVNKIVSQRGCIVKWAPQTEVLGHPAVEGFWSHCGWNSTLESIVEGMPMICRPFHMEQKLNALYIKPSRV